MATGTQDRSRLNDPDAALSLYHLLDPEVTANPYPLFHRLRQEDPVHWDPFLHAWVVTRYTDVLEVLHTYSADRTPSPEQLAAMGLSKLGPIAQVMVQQMLFMDAPAHTRLRGLASKAFTPARVEGMRAHIRDIVNHLLDDVVSRGRMDVIAEIAEPLPAIVTAEMLGVPVADRNELKAWSANFAEMLGNFQHNPDHADLMLRTVDEMTKYFRQAVNEIRDHPREGLIHSLLTAEIDGDRLSDEEIIANTIVTMVGGQETTTNLIGNGLLTLLQHPSEMEKLCQNLHLVPSAVEEMLRYESPSQHTARLAPEDRQLGGKLIKKRQAVMAVMAAANRDPERFPDPDRFDIERKDNRHLAFGYAAHFCFGAPLARVEGQVVFDAMLQRLPNLRLEPQKLVWRTNSGLRGLNSLLVSFGSAGTTGPGNPETRREQGITVNAPSEKPASAEDARRTLLQDYLNRHVAQPRIPRRAAGVAIPLSCSQEQVWLHSEIAPEIPVYNEPLVLFRKGRLDIAALELSFNAIIRRHEAWRTNFELHGSRPVQIVREPWEIKFAVADLRPLPAGEREEEARRISAAQAKKPFNLALDPLLRGTVVQLADEEFQVCLALHHIIFDGFSIYQILLPELLACYRAFLQGQEPHLPVMSLQYGDFAVWQRNREIRDGLSGQMDYWRTQLEGELPALQLPTDRPRPVVQSFRGAMHAFQLSPELSCAVREFSRREGATLFMALLAAFAALLHRYTGQSDVVIGTVSSGRRQPELESLLGCFQNPVALRLRLTGNPSFRDLLKQAREVTLGALSHDEVPFGTVVKEIHPGRDFSRNPIAQVLLTLAPTLPEVEPGWNLTQMGIDVGAAKFDLELELDDRPEGIRGRFVYNTDLFDASTVARAAGHWDTLLSAAVTGADRHVSHLEILTPAEKDEFTRWNSTRAEYPALCLHQLVEAQADRTPDAMALRQENRTLTYRQLEAEANQLAHDLLRRGVKPGSPVGVCLSSSPELAVALLAVLKAGAACLPLDPSYPVERLAYMMQDSGAPLLLTDGSAPAALLELAAQVVDLRRCAAEISTAPATRPTGVPHLDATAYVIYTSGSTGKPRGVELAHRGLVNQTTAAGRLYALTAADSVLQFCALSFDSALEEIFSTLAHGATLVLKTPDMPLAVSDFVRWIGERNISMLDLPTAYWHEMVHQLAESRQSLPRRLRLIVVGGEKASSAALQSWRRIAGEHVRWINTYGPTEASVFATAFEPGRDIPASLSIGRPIANTRIHILDPQLQPLPVGVRGELHIAGDGVALGYRHRPELNAQKFLPDVFGSTGGRLYKTGDMARYLPGGEIEFLGRTDDQVKIRGFRVELGEIEALFNQHPEVTEAVVVARETPGGEKVLAAFLVPVRQPGPDIQELRGFVRDRLPDYMVPAHFVMLEKLPLTPNGKVDRRSLPAVDVSDAGAAEMEVAPQDALEAQLVQIWESLLGKRNIGVRQNFFDLGGHSLLAVRLMHRLEQTFGRKMPITTLFQAPTIEHLAALLREKGWATSWSSLVPIQPAGSKPPFFLVHGGGGAVLVYRELAQQLGSDQPVYGLQAQGLDGSQPALDSVEAMATRYLEEIRTLQPQGPYFIGGLSFGGTVAYEMAQQLRADGEQVALLALLDTFSGRHETHAELLIKLSRLPLREQMGYVSRKASGYIRNWKRRIGRFFLPEALKRVRAAIHVAGANYEMRPYPGEATLFYAQEKSLRGERDPHAGWQHLAQGGLVLREIQGGHVSMLSGANVRHLAAELMTCIDAAQTRAAEEPQLYAGASRN